MLIRMGTFLVLLAGLSRAGPLAAADKNADGKTVWNFSDDEPGEIAEGFSARMGVWNVVDDAGNRVLAQQAENADGVFNVVLVEESAVKDVDLSVRFKPISGKFDQGGGLVWRARDEKNYYIARYNPLEDNFRVYKVENGKRSKFFQSADIKHTPGWHTLRVTMHGSRISCFLDGKKYLEADDKTFSQPGMIGLWSKADAQTYFDDLTLVGDAEPDDE